MNKMELDNPDMFLLSYHQGIFMLIASIIMLYSAIKRRELLRWVPAYFLFTIGLFYNALWYPANLPRVITHILYLASVISILIPIFYEYNLLFIKKVFEIKKLKRLFPIIIYFSPIIFGIKIIIFLFMIISMIMLFKIYRKKQTLIHIFLFFSMIVGTSAVFSMIAQDFNMMGSLEFQYSSSFVFITFLIATSFASIIDQKLGESEKKLRESESFFRSIAENIDAGLTIIQNNEIIYLNDRVTEILGYSKKELMNLTILDIALPEEKERLTKFLEAIKKKESTLNKIDIWIQTNEGEKRCIHNHYAKLIKDNNMTIRYILTADITDRKIAEKKIKNSKENYRKAYTRINLYKDLFTHNMNNILHALVTSIDIFNLEMKDSEKNNTIREFQKSLKEQINRGVKLINTVQKFSEIEESDKKLEVINIIEVLNSVIRTIKEDFNEKKINTEIKSDNNDFVILADEFLFDVFTNILMNAVKHNINKEIEILIILSKTNKNGTDYFKMEIIDNGRGIPDAMKEHIFLRGTRNNKSVSGLGLGLSIVLNILDKYKAKIWVENRVPDDYTKGSNFILLFPEIK